VICNFQWHEISSASYNDDVVEHFNQYARFLRTKWVFKN
jgi:hypothetical protein